MDLPSPEAEEILKWHLNRRALPLAFDQPLETHYLTRENNRRQKRYLLSGIVAILFYNFFFLGDRIMIPDIFGMAWRLRLFGVTPAIALAMFLVNLRPFQRHTELFALALMLITSLGIIYLLTQSHHPNAAHYYTGIIIIAIFGNIVARIRLKTAVISSGMILLVYCLSLAHMPAMGPESGPNSALVLFASLTISLFGTYQLETEARRDFLREMLQTLHTHKLKEANEELTRMSRTDGLTGVINRQHFDRIYARQWRISCRNGEWLGFLFIDIDHFKLYNDHYGHQKGDATLKQVATVISKSVGRAGDTTARYGGEEFVVLLPQTELENAHFIAQRIASGIESLHIEHTASPTAPYITLSIGVASTIPTVNQWPESLIKKADDALYQAKEKGRDLILCSEDMPLRLHGRV